MNIVNNYYLENTKARALNVKKITTAKTQRYAGRGDLL